MVLRKSGFNPYAAGNKVYGMIRDAPNIGPVDKMGYKERDARARLRKQAVSRRLKKLSQQETEV